MKKTWLIILSILITLVLTACLESTPQHNDPSKERVFFGVGAMSTTISVTMYVEPERKEEIMENVEEILYFYHDLTDNFKLKSGVNNITYINNQAAASDGEATVEIEKELYNILELGLQVQEETNGYFDIAMGEIIDIWKEVIKNNQKTGKVSEAELQETYEAVDAIILPENPVLLNEEAGKYYVTLKKGAKLDLGAIAKGYAVQKVVEYIESEGITQYIINGGSSSIDFGKDNPRTQDGNYVFELLNPLMPYQGYGFAYYSGQNQNITTSGSYLQYVEDLEGNWYHHIISPKTRRPSNNFYTITLIGVDGGLLDAYSTALFCMSPEEIENFVEGKDIQVATFNLDGTVTPYFMSSGYEPK
ncbi:FAD:protein FMN transferase [Acholeplasma equirhinis]|uniref:FAD:protein FMN transferase n=1 Tax=Acholeplasma equirhinis TaxID=555393 RepID=UPI00197AF051|nr:FAD:protein FMN transferase [Acholeplasma equirhinis]MBN3491094.1 FAD:protein FMN transferase [Acholeplasma equirhinis]